MIIWSGWGVLSLLIAVVVGGLVSVAATPVLTGMGLPLAGNLALVVGLLAAAAVNWMVGRRLNGQPGREMIDKATGRTVVLRRRHTLFFIRMEWWSVAMAALAVVMLLVTLFGPPPTQRPRRADAGTWTTAA